MFTCHVCEKKFSRRDNLLRHHKTMHNESDNEQEAPLSDDDPKRSDNELEDMSGDNSDNEETVDPWEGIVSKAYNRCEREFNEKVNEYVQTEELTENVARDRAFRDMRSKYRKVMTDEFLGRIAWMNALKGDPSYKAIKKTSKDLQILDEYSSEEAWKYAVNKRKFLFENILKRYQPPRVTARNSQEGSQRRAANTVKSNAVQAIDKWAEDQIDSLQNDHSIQIIGRKY